MGMVSTITTAEAIQNEYTPGFREAAFRNDQFLAAMRALGMEESEAGGGTAHNWLLNSAGGAPAAFVEGGPLPEPVPQTWVKASVSPLYLATMIQISGHSRDALKNGRINAIEAEMSLAQRDLIDLRNTSFLGSSGLQTAVDATTTYAGIARGSAAYFESTESSTNTLAGLRAAYRATQDAEKAGKTSAHLVSPTILQWYATLAGLPGTSNFILGNSGAGPMNVDVGFAWTGSTFMGKPIIAIPDLTSSEWYGLDFSAGNIKHKIWRSLSVIFHHMAGDSEGYEVSTGSALIVEMPKWQFKMTGLS